MKAKRLFLAISLLIALCLLTLCRPTSNSEPGTWNLELGTWNLELGSSGDAHAQSANGWTKLGSLPAGAWEIAQDGIAPDVLYALGDDGIMRSSDDGTTWQSCNSDAQSMRAVSPLQGQNTTTVLFASTAAGLRRSNDSCRTWSDVPTQEIAPSGAHIRWLAPYPNNLTVLYAGMDGLGGLYRSVDGGNSWQAASSGLPPGGWVTTLTADPLYSADIYVGLKYPGSNHPSSYLYMSTDGGLNWRSSSSGLHIIPNNGSFINGLAWAGDELFASTSQDGLYASLDRGASWQKAVTPLADSSALAPQSAPPAIYSFFASQDGALFISTSEGVYESLDAAHSWQSFGPTGPNGSSVILNVDSVTGHVLWASTVPQEPGTGKSQGAIWTYTIPQGTASVPTAAAAPTSTPTPTPPPPPILPTFTPVPPTATPSPSPVPPTPRPTLVQGYKPSDPAQPGDPQVYTFFSETSHNLGHGFRDFWQANGGLGQFGYPITEEFVENGITVQYFERARLEYRDGSVTLGLLGTELTQGQFFKTVPFFPSTDTDAFFGATGHSVEGPFLTFWQDNGREALLGYPISESFMADGSDYQWFERARLEWHSDLPADRRIVLGNIGTEALQKRGWIP